MSKLAAPPRTETSIRSKMPSCILLATYIGVIYLFLVLEVVMFNFSKHMNTPYGYALVVFTMLVLAVPPVSLQVAVITHVYARAQQQWADDEERLAEAAAAATTDSLRRQLQTPPPATNLWARYDRAEERQLQGEFAERGELLRDAAAAGTVSTAGVAAACTATAAEERGVPEAERAALSPSPGNLTPGERVQARWQLAQLLGTGR